MFLHESLNNPVDLLILASYLTERFSESSCKIIIKMPQIQYVLETKLQKKDQNIKRVPW